MTRTQLVGRRPAALLLAAVTLAGCAGAQLKNPPAWPPPPEKPRIRFLRTFQAEGDLPTGALWRIWRALVPVPPETVIRQPMGLALSPDEQRLYVATGVRGSVIRVDLRSGRFERMASEGRHAPANAIGVAVDDQENLYVADLGGNRVLVFDRDDHFLREFGQDKLSQPRAIALDRKAQTLFVVSGVSGSSLAHRVDVFSLKGEHLRTFGKRGAGPGEFNFPTGVTVAPDGRLFVADMLNFRVQILDQEGTQLGSFGELGTGAPGHFDKVRATAFDTFGNVYVTDAQQGSVQIFNSRFQPLMAFGGRFLEPGYFQVPGAIVIDSRNHVFVADSATHRISEYELINTSAEDSTQPGPAAAPAAESGATPSK